VELPYRLIQLYTFSREVILDPFMGSGQSALAALKAGRHFAGYEPNEDDETGGEANQQCLKTLPK